MESCKAKSRSMLKKVEVYNEVLQQLKESKHPEVHKPDFDDKLWAHFNRLPTRYALEVNMERIEDVLMHKRLLQLAHDFASRLAFDVRIVQVLPVAVSHENSGESMHSCSLRRESPPSFGSSPDLEALSLETSESDLQDGNIVKFPGYIMHEITFSAYDKPKLLSQLTSLLAEVDLNIQEAHAFSTVDGYSLDVFVVQGWPFEEVDQLRDALEQEVLKIEKNTWPNQLSLSPPAQSCPIEIKREMEYLKRPSDETNVWEINPQYLKFETKVASGSYGDLYKGTYHSQDVAIKILKKERLNLELQEFAQEISIMRMVRHKNIVQFVGACTCPPNLCIVTEFMYGGSVYDYLHKQKGTYKLRDLIKAAIDISKGMNYLHQSNIIHRDLKAANLLMDENGVVKIADFGVARVKAQTGVMTAETGTYRWMAPEVIEHKYYDHKADVFSFGVVLWEMLTKKLPYDHLTPMQAAVGVVKKGLRPVIPRQTHPQLVHLFERCWQQDPTLRPDFSQIQEMLQKISREIQDDEEDILKENMEGCLLP